MSELKPCPFCKEAKELNTIPQHGEWFAGWCSRCDAVGPLALTKELAIAAWNTRADSTPRPWLRAEEVTEPGWYWLERDPEGRMTHRAIRVREYGGELVVDLRCATVLLKNVGTRFQRIPEPEPELPEEGE